jgi:hypothetical protein
LDFVRLIVRALVCSIMVLGIVCGVGGRAGARPSQEMMPEEAAAKAKQLLQQVIATLGGPAYLNVHDSDCSGKIAQFGAVGDVPDFTGFRDLWVYPDKNRTEYSTQGEHTILGFLMGSDGLLITHGGANVTVFNGSEGWTLDRKGVADQPDEVVKNFNEDLHTSLNTMLRTRLNEPGVEARYSGPDIIDLKEADWIEFTDREHHDLRLGIEKSTHLPLRWVITTRDPDTKRTSDITTSYVQYMMQDGVRTPLNIEMYSNGARKTQTYLSTCKYNTDLSPQLFTRAALEQRASEMRKKGHKDSKDKN